MGAKRKPFSINKVGTNYSNRADNCIAQGALTNSKRVQSHVEGVYPTHLKKGSACYVYDEYGTRFVDYIGGLGSSVLGHSPRVVAKAISDELNNGISLSLSSTIEVECAELLKTFFPMIDKLKFLKNGSDACNAAIRFARAHTKRSLILTEGYHGSSDLFVSMTPPAAGITDRFDVLPLKGNEDKMCDAAAVIVEPVNLDWSDKRIQELNKLRNDTLIFGSVLIFDEIITGMRFPGYSVSRFTGIDPDLICLGKAIASGMPLSVVGGKKEIMDNDQVFYSMTFAGERLSLAACMATIQEIKRLDVDTLWRNGSYFQERFNKLGDVRIEGYPTRGVFVGEPLQKALFFQECIKAGVLFGPSFFYGFMHKEHDELTLSICNDVFNKLRMNKVKLEGKLPQSPFATKIRGVI